MFKGVPRWAVLACAVFLAGCATTGGRNYQTDIDALNAKVTALQGQLAAKDQEITHLQAQVSDQRMASDAAQTAMRKAEDDKRELEERLRDAESKKAKAIPSDLK